MSLYPVLTSPCLKNVYGAAQAAKHVHAADVTHLGMRSRDHGSSHQSRHTDCHTSSQLATLGRTNQHMACRGLQP